jgi:hypothetical protein
MLTQQDQAARNQALTKGTEGDDLSGKNLPTSDRAEARTNLLSRVVSAAALSAALATNGVPARAQTNAPTEPTPNVGPAVPGATNGAPQAAGPQNIPLIDAAVAQQFITTQVPANPAPQAYPAPPPGGAPVPAPAPAPALDVTKSNITILEKRPFCMTDEGKVLLINDRGSQVRRPGSFVEGSPSTGTALQALAYAKEHLEQMNGGKIPDGYKAVLHIRSAGVANSAELNLNAIPAVKDLGQIAHGMAKNDPLTGQAIKMIHNGVNIHVLNDGGTFTMTFKNKFGDVPLLMTVELEKR